jgi:hypothetical protein
MGVPKPGVGGAPGGGAIAIESGEFVTTTVVLAGPVIIGPPNPLARCCARSAKTADAAAIPTNASTPNVAPTPTPTGSDLAAPPLLPSRPLACGDSDGDGVGDGVGEAVERPRHEPSVCAKHATAEKARPAAFCELSVESTTVSTASAAPASASPEREPLCATTSVCVSAVSL